LTRDTEWNKNKAATSTRRPFNQIRERMGEKRGGKTPRRISRGYQGGIKGVSRGQIEEGGDIGKEGESGGIRYQMSWRTAMRWEGMLKWKGSHERAVVE